MATVVILSLSILLHTARSATNGGTIACGDVKSGTIGNGATPVDFTFTAVSGVPITFKTCNSARDAYLAAKPSGSWEYCNPNAGNTPSGCTACSGTHEVWELNLNSGSYPLQFYWYGGSGNSYYEIEMSCGTPTQEPTTAEPTSYDPTTTPTRNPISSPTKFPTQFPTITPSKNPSAYPTKFPTQFPTISPSKNPTEQPTNAPITDIPTTAPTTSNPTSANPTQFPTNVPSATPSDNPSAYPTTFPSKFPTMPPSNNPTTFPSKFPTTPPSANPTTFPSKFPTTPPSNNPTLQPSSTPTRQPSQFPSQSPTFNPSVPPTTSAPTITRQPTTEVPTTNAPSTSVPTTSGPTYADGNEVTEMGATEATNGHLLNANVESGSTFWVLTVLIVFMLMAICCIVLVFCVKKRKNRKQQHFADKSGIEMNMTTVVTNGNNSGYGFMITPKSTASVHSPPMNRVPTTTLSELGMSEDTPTNTGTGDGGGTDNEDIDGLYTTNAQRPHVTPGGDGGNGGNNDELQRHGTKGGGEELMEGEDELYTVPRVQTGGNDNGHVTKGNSDNDSDSEDQNNMYIKPNNPKSFDTKGFVN